MFVLVACEVAARHCAFDFPYAVAGVVDGKNGVVTIVEGVARVGGSGSSRSAVISSSKPLPKSIVWGADTARTFAFAPFTASLSALNCANDKLNCSRSWA